MADFTLKQDTLDNSNIVEIGSPEDIIDQFKQEIIDEIEKKIIDNGKGDKEEQHIRFFNLGINQAIEIIKSK